MPQDEIPASSLRSEERRKPWRAWPYRGGEAGSQLRPLGISQIAHTMAWSERQNFGFLQGNS